MPISSPSILTSAPPVAGIDGRVGLDEILKGVGISARRPFKGRDNAECHRRGQAEGVADSDRPVTGPQFFGIPEIGDRQVCDFFLDFDDRNIGERIQAHHLCLKAALVGCFDFDFIGAGHHMVVGKNIAVFRHDDARSEALLAEFSFFNGRRVRSAALAPPGLLLLRRSEEVIEPSAERIRRKIDKKGYLRIPRYLSLSGSRIRQ